MSTPTPPFNIKTEIQGHRGARGLWPENSIYGFINTAQLGIKTLEMDVVINGDGEVLISHDPYFNSQFCLDPEGKEIRDEKKYNLYLMPQSEIEKFDCGTKYYSRFPEQEKIKVSKPLLKDLLIVMDKEGFKTINYNIEIKSRKEWRGIYQPESIDDYVDNVLKTLEYLPYDRYNLQSFDIDILRSIYRQDPKVRLAYLIEKQELSKTTIDSLDFPIYAFSPDYHLLSQELVAYYQSKGVKVIPWTVNETKDMKRLAEWGVNGIITDYPNRWKALIQSDQ
jgi:glycerophosphoryl diester phosphodiesterase